MTEFQTFTAAVSQIPSARWWLEEVLLRGSPDGTIAGAHVVLGAEIIDPLGGVSRTVKGPYSLDALSVLSGQPAADWTAVLGAALAAQQHTIEVHLATIAARDATVLELQSSIQTLQAQLAAAQAAKESE